MAETYVGIVENGKVVLPKQAKLNNGTPVLVVPQSDSENEWLTVARAAKRFQISATLLRQWIKSGKVRVHLHDPKLINASDVEDATEQHELLGISMRVIEREE